MAKYWIKVNGSFEETRGPTEPGEHLLVSEHRLDSLIEDLVVDGLDLSAYASREPEPGLHGEYTVVTSPIRPATLKGIAHLSEHWRRVSGGHAAEPVELVFDPRAFRWGPKGPWHGSARFRWVQAYEPNGDLGPEGEGVWEVETPYGWEPVHRPVTELRLNGAKYKLFSGGRGHTPLCWVVDHVFNRAGAYDVTKSLASPETAVLYVHVGLTSSALDHNPLATGQTQKDREDLFRALLRVPIAGEKGKGTTRIRVTSSGALDDAQDANRVAKSEPKRWTIESHGDGYALYYGRDSSAHGYNVIHLSDPAHQWGPIRDTILKLLNDHEVGLTGVPHAKCNDGDKS